MFDFDFDINYHQKWHPQVFCRQVYLFATGICSSIRDIVALSVFFLCLPSGDSAAVPHMASWRGRFATALRVTRLLKKADVWVRTWLPISFFVMEK